MKELTCIVCPIGCQLSVEDSGENLSVTGNKCQRGLVYAKEEILAPKRIVTATCKIEGEECCVRRIPVKTDLPLLKEKIPILLEDLYKIKVKLPVKTGDILIANWMEQGINIVVTRSIS